MHQGIFLIMWYVPFWVQPLLLWVFFQGGIRIIRWVQEGEPYDHSHASVWGDLALCSTVAVASYILQYTELPDLIELPEMQVIFLVVAVLISGKIFGAEATYWGDIFHAYVVAPILIFALFVAAIIMVTYGNLLFIALALALLTVWASFLALDVTQGRLNQQAYRKKLGKS